MNIIASSFTQKKLTMKFFNSLFVQSLKASPFSRIKIMLAESLKNNTIQSPYKSCAQLLKANGISSTNKEYNKAFTVLKKLGIILKHNNFYYLNPLVEEKSTSRTYELVIQYYNILFQDTCYELFTVDQLRSKAVDEYMLSLLQPNNPSKALKSFNEYYDIAFNSRGLRYIPSADKAIYYGVNETYRHLASNHIVKLVYEHALMVEEQGLVSITYNPSQQKTYYEFKRFPLKDHKGLIKYTQTNQYLDNLPQPDEEIAKQFFSDTKYELIEQFKEEDLQAPIAPPKVQDEIQPRKLTYEDIAEEVKQDMAIAKPLTKRPYTPEELERINIPPRTPEEDYEYFYQEWVKSGRPQTYDYFPSSYDNGMTPFDCWLIWDKRYVQSRISPNQDQIEQLYKDYCEASSKLDIKDVDGRYQLYSDYLDKETQLKLSV